MSFPAQAGPPGLGLLEDVFDAVVLLSSTGHLTWTNAGFERLTGIASAPQAPDWLLRALAPAGVSPAALRRQLAAAAPLTYELPLLRPDSGPGWVRLKLRPQGPGAFVGLLEDITPARHAAREQEERFRYLTEHVPGVLFQWQHSPEGQSGLTYVSPQLLTIFGLAPDQAHRLVEFLHPADRTRWQAALAAARHPGADWLFEGRLLVPGQPLRWCRGSAQLSATDAQGRLYSGMLSDITALKRAEETVQAYEQRWRLAIERFGDGAWEFNYRTGEEYFSDAYRTMLGYPATGPDALPGTWLQHVHPDDQVLSLAAAAAYLRGDEAFYSVERRLLCRDGRYKWVLTRGLITQYDEQGQPLIMTGVHTDITAVKQAALAIEASTLRFATTIANFQEGILLADENQRVVLANEALCRLFHLTTPPAALVGTDTGQLSQRIQAHFRDPAAFARRYAALEQGRRLATAEVFELADGRTVQGDFVPIFVADRPVGHLWKLQDITERKTAEDLLRQREEKYRGIIDNMNLGLVEMDLASRVTFTNQAFCDITGYCGEEFANQHVMSLLLSADDLHLTQQRDQQRRQGESETYELAITTKDGQPKWLLVSAAPLYDDRRQVCGSIGITLDITHQKQLEHHLRAAKEQAEDSARAKELFLANMSHEIRTPMNAILGMGQLLAKTPLDEGQQTYLRAIATSGENLLVILNDILDLSKIGAGQLLIERIGFSVPGLLHQIEKSLHFKAEEKGLSFYVQADPRLPEVVLGDPYRITQVLLNLAGNSLKFTERGAVTVACELVQAAATKVELRFQVTDTGIGIDADFLADIFKEFSQEDSSVTRKFGGTGLGLSISRQLVHLMGGEIRLDSRKHHGTRSHFTLRLPVGSAADLPRKTLVTPGTRARLQGRQVLLVEDNYFNRQIAKGFLHNAGLVVTEAENGAQAVELARQRVFDAVLMDVQMPVMNGLEATAHLREQLGLTTPIIALTANAIKGERERCLQAGMDDYLAKPFREDDLLKVLCRWTLGSPGELEPPLPAAAVVAEPPPPLAAPAPLYSLELIHRIGQGDPAFTVLMLDSFIESAQEAIGELRAAVAAEDTAQLRAATHKLKPSLDHLQVYRLLPTVIELDTWRAPFDNAVLPPLVEQTVALLEQLIEQMTRELANLQAELTPPPADSGGEYSI